ncbi:membrane protein [Actinoplanes sp. SE50]|nr:ycgQ-like uncharacterized protein [Actinoplanes sp. SE50/110]ATO79570.1 membrane protein [Actinoplanes sp. SE50]SLL96971.1 membrane protein [Actinoplanes sp. SE50/110]
MLLFGGAITRATLTDVFLRYVKEGLRPFLLVAGILLVAAAVMTLWHEWRPGGDGHHDDGHGHGQHEPAVGWLLILPVLAILLISPPALGSYTAKQAGSVSVQPDTTSDYPPLPAGEPVTVNLLDYASRAIFDKGKSLAGRTVRMTGFITPDAAGKPMLTRIVLICCAADGQPIKVGLTGGTPIDAPADTWVEIIGVYSTQTGTDPVNKAPIAYVEVKSWQQIAQPKQPYA